MYNRLKAIRKKLCMTQSAFGEAVGATRPMIAAYESGKVIPPEAVIRLICTTFGVDYDWLKTGEGEMYASDDDAVLAALDDLMSGENEETKALIRSLARMDEKELAAINKLIRTLKEELG